MCLVMESRVSRVYIEMEKVGQGIRDKITHGVWKITSDECVLRGDML